MCRSSIYDLPPMSQWVKPEGRRITLQNGPNAVRPMAGEAVTRLLRTTPVLLVQITPTVLGVPYFGHGNRHNLDA